VRAAVMARRAPLRRVQRAVVPARRRQAAVSMMRAMPPSIAAVL